MFNYEPLSQYVDDVIMVELTRHQDHRGYFIETYRKTWMEWFVGEPPFEFPREEFVFEFFSFSNNVGTIRGMHAQTMDDPQAKLITVVSGKILDVFVDARVGSPTFGKYHSVEISSQRPKLLYLPKGLYHGFVTLEPNTTVLYKSDRYHNPDAEVGLIWNDPTLNIQWPNSTFQILSERDKSHPTWENCYKFEGLK